MKCDSISQSYWGLNLTIFANLVQLTRDIFRAFKTSFSLKSRSKLVERSLFAITDLLDSNPRLKRAKVTALPLSQMEGT